MKKLLTLCITAAMLLGAANAQAIEFKVKGMFLFVFDYVDGGNFMSQDRAGNSVYGQQWAAVHQSRDNFEAIQRTHLQIEAIASESLSGTVHFEMGDYRWGYGADGGALGADGQIVRVKHAYLDWIVPDTEWRFRMGLQAGVLPSTTVDNPVLIDDVAGITSSYKFNNNISLTGFWYRPYNDNWAGDNGSDANAYDNMDLFGLVLPISYDGFKITPWAVGGAMGHNTVNPQATSTNSFNISIHSPRGISSHQIRDGLFPAAFATTRPQNSIFTEQYTSLFWGGVTTDITAADPWRFTFDAIYGATSTGRDYLDREGWYATALIEYKMDWGTPGIYAWYFSGDDSDVNNGSERMPYISTTNSIANSQSSFGYRGSSSVGGGKGVLDTNPNGTWGVGFRLKKMSFVDDLSHLFRVNFFGGTNAPEMADYITGRKTTSGNGAVYRQMTDFNSFGTYLTTEDTGIEINFDTRYKIYDNLTADIELGYIHLWLSEDAWGRIGNQTSNSLHYKDAWKMTVNLTYRF